MNRNNEYNNNIIIGNEKTSSVLHLMENITFLCIYILLCTIRLII
jgi:hypothetical protein